MKAKRILAIALAAIMVIAAFAGCKAPVDLKPLVVADQGFTEKFSPFFSTSVPDTNTMEYTQITLLENDRAGSLIYNGIEGETREYNGKKYTYKGATDLKVDVGEDTTTYTFTLRKGIKFADGVEATADDIIFSLYVLLDPTYDGAQTLYSVPIIGSAEYRTQANAALAEKYRAIYDLLLNSSGGEGPLGGAARRVGQLGEVLEAKNDKEAVKVLAKIFGYDPEDEELEGISELDFLAYFVVGLEDDDIAELKDTGVDLTGFVVEVLKESLLTRYLNNLDGVIEIDEAVSGYFGEADSDVDWPERPAEDAEEIDFAAYVEESEAVLERAEAVIDRYNSLVTEEMVDWADSLFAEKLGYDFWYTEVEAIVNYCVSNYAASYAEDLGVTADDIFDNEGLQVAFGMMEWQFASFDEDGVFTTNATGTQFDLKNSFPTLDDFVTEAQEMYGGSAFDFFSVETAGETANPFNGFENAFIAEFAAKDPESGGAKFENVEGIKKIDDYTVSITTEGFDATSVYALSLYLAPMHYYGDASKYDYDNNKFGFDYGDLSIIKAKTPAPMGAGPYKYVKFEDKIVYLEANEFYYKGAPIIKYLQLKDTAEADLIPGVAQGTVDVAEPSISANAVNAIQSYNTNGELSGDTIHTNLIDYRGYGYIGLNAKAINVGGQIGSEASKNLRKGLATMIAAYRDLTVDSYYGERASVINYPISNTSWAAPQKTDQDYRPCYSLKLDGSPIYDDKMSSEERYDAALAAAIDYFKAAGYTWDEGSGKFTAAPDGAKFQYEILIAGGGSGDHPSFLLAQRVSEAMKSIGFDIIIDDPSDNSIWYNKIEAGTLEIWCGAWQSTLDPDIYQIYHSSNAHGEGGTDSNNYWIRDPQLDQLIIDAKSKDDQTFRKAMYKACFDIILDWAVEVPIYQRSEAIIFGVKNINIKTLTPDITTNYPWAKEIEKLRTNG